MICMICIYEYIDEVHKTVHICDGIHWYIVKTTITILWGAEGMCFSGEVTFLLLSNVAPYNVYLLLSQVLLIIAYLLSTLPVESGSIQQ